MPSSIGTLVRYRPLLWRAHVNESVSFVLCYMVTVYPLGLSFRGAPIATSLSFNLVLLASILYAYYFVPRTAWTPIGRGVWQRWGLLARLGIAGIGESDPCIDRFVQGMLSVLNDMLVQTASEWWSWELIGCKWQSSTSCGEADNFFSGCQLVSIH